MLFFSITHCHLCLAGYLDDPVIINGMYYYSVFISGTTEEVIDGTSHVGVMCLPSLASSQYDKESIVLCDMCRGGSSIRIINQSGIFTLAGSRKYKGFIDGAPDIARFQGIDYGNKLANGVSVIDKQIFIADTQNSAVRTISPEGNVRTLFDYRTEYDKKPISYPVHVAPCLESSDYMSLIISDSGNRRMLLATFTSTTTSVITLLAENLQPDQLFVTKDNKLLYYSTGYTPEVLKVINLTSRKGWNIGNSGCLGYKSALALTNDEKELLYYGIVNNVAGVYSLSTETTPDVAPTLCPTLKFLWPNNFNDIQDVVTRDDTSWWVLTKTSLFLVSTHAIDNSSSGSGIKPPNRNPVIAAFPTDSLPNNDSCLMSEFFYWVRKDVEIAYRTNDYLTQFEPLNSPSMLIGGSVNVSTWCNRITASKSNDGTITFLKFWGPLMLSPQLTKRALIESNWTNTKRFLQTQGIKKEPFCFFDCGGQCKTKTFSIEMCLGYKSFSCDDVCKGTIASGAVMGACGVVLLILMILSPSNILNALTMVPIV
ncbi:unnamed protein product [Phytomonas sp. Hart1]|nr:unnamed protein product [Phytomonas sp. Hart1]|eukprot:CCW71390.1 unnamed protein product [Phytomonas sp. isolate Hart1]